MQLKPYKVFTTCKALSWMRAKLLCPLVIYQETYQMDLTHNLNINIKTCLLIILFSFLSACASTKKEIIPDITLNPGVKFELTSFDFDLVTSRNVPGFLNQEQTHQIMLQQFEMALAKEGMLAEAGDKSAVKIAVIIDYRRHYFGEDTPFPMDKVSSPYFYYGINIQDNGTIKPYIRSQERIIPKMHLYGIEFIGSPKNIADDINFSLSVANDVAKGLIDKTPEYPNYTKNTHIQIQYRTKIQSLLAGFELERQDPAYLEEKYISKQYIQAFISRIQDQDIDERIEAYEDIQKVWYNDGESFDIIAKRLMGIYKNELRSSQLDEAEAAVEALAASGLLTYKKTLKEISQNAKSEDLREVATDSLETLDNRHAQALLIHRPLAADINMTWQQKQLYNMIQSNDFYLQKIGVKRIYREYPKNELLLDALSENLNGATRRGYRAELSADYHAWICRVLGMSEMTKYKTKLDYITSHASNKKVRNFAEKFADELDI